MTYSDFSKIDHFTPNEILKTGARIQDVKMDLMLGMDILRTTLGVPLTLLHNGLTSGEHKSAGHRDGKAADFALLVDTIKYQEVVYGMLASGFRHIGVYWSGRRYTFHAEKSDTWATWSAKPKAVVNGIIEWSYSALLNDPKTGGIL